MAAWRFGLGSSPLQKEAVQLSPAKVGETKGLSFVAPEVSVGGSNHSPLMRSQVVPAPTSTALRDPRGVSRHREGIGALNVLGK